MYIFKNYQPQNINNVAGKFFGYMNCLLDVRSVEDCTDTFQIAVYASQPTSGRRESWSRWIVCTILKPMTEEEHRNFFSAGILPEGAILEFEGGCSTYGSTFASLSPTTDKEREDLQKFEDFAKVVSQVQKNERERNLFDLPCVPSLVGMHSTLYGQTNNTIGCNPNDFKYGHNITLLESAFNACTYAVCRAGMNGGAFEAFMFNRGEVFRLIDGKYWLYCCDAASAKFAVAPKYVGQVIQPQSGIGYGGLTYYAAGGSLRTWSGSEVPRVTGIIPSMTIVQSEAEKEAAQFIAANELEA